jgi:hypothetical protein
VFFFFIFVGENLKFVELEFWGKNIWNSFVEWKNILHFVRGITLWT